MSIREISIIIFDLDGTLIETRLDIAVSVNHVRVTMGLEPLDTEIVSTYIGDGIHPLLSRAIESTNTQAVEKAIILFREHYWDHCMDNSYVYPGVMETLEKLADNRTLAIASNKREDFTRKMVRGYRMDTYFSTIIGGDTLQWKKPDRKVLDHILHLHGKSPEEALMVGDSATDVKSGRNAGVRTVAVTYGIGNTDEMMAENPEYTIDSFEKLKDVVSEIKVEM